MRIVNLTLVIGIIITLIYSCGGNISKQPANAEGFGVVEKELKAKFGDNAYYTDLSITYNESIGNIIGVTVTKEPESLKMGQWNLTQDKWQQNSDITIEVPKGTKAAEYMFQLNDRINLPKLGELVEKSQKQLTKEKNIGDSKLIMTFIKFPSNGDIANAEYGVILEPQNGGTSFTFRYTLDGDLIKIDY